MTMENTEKLEQTSGSSAKMGTMPEGKLLLTMSLPMMISMLVQAMYNITDSYFVGQYSDEAFTAVSLAFPMQSLMIAIAAGTGVGVNALVSRTLGERDNKKASQVAMNGIFIYIASYVVVAILGLLIARPFFQSQLKVGQENILELGVDYLTIVMVCSFGMFAQFIFERLLQATGRTIFTMISQSLGAIINVILDPILIFGYFGMPKLGIAGAAIATVIGQIIAAIVAFVWNIKKNKEISFNFRNIKPDGRIIKAVYQIAIPSIVMQSIGSVMSYGMNNILNSNADIEVGKASVDVFGAYFKIQSFFFMPVFGLNNGLIPIVSYNYGARKKNRMLNTLKYGYMISIVFMVIGFASFMAVPDKLLSIFNLSSKALEIGTPALKIIAIHYLVAWYCIVTGSLFQAVGRASYCLWVSIARQLVVLLPVAYILEMVGGVAMIWWCFPIAEVMSMIITLTCFRLVKKKILDKMA